MKRISFVGCSIAVLTAGCAVYTPLETNPEPPLRTEVRVNLTTPGAVRMTDLLGRPVRELEGELLEWSADSVYVALLSATQWGRPWDSVDTLRLARDEVASLEKKEIDRTRTALLVGGGSVALGAAIAAMFRAAGGEQGEPAREPPDRILIPLLSIIH